MLNIYNNIINLIMYYIKLWLIIINVILSFKINSQRFAFRVSKFVVRTSVNFIIDKYFYSFYVLNNLKLKKKTIYN